MSNELQYFAALPPMSADFGREVMKRVDAYYDYLRASGRYDQVIRAHQAYYGRSTTQNGARSDRVGRTGAQNELATVKVNHFRNLAQHMLTLCTSQRPAPQPVASNSDSKTHAQVTLAHGLLDYYSREKRVVRRLRDAAEGAVTFSEGYIETLWDEELGADYTAITQADGSVKRIKEGDLKYVVHSMLDVGRDPTVESWEEKSWCWTRHWVNRWELVARYPELRERILALPTKLNDPNRLANRFLSGASAGGAESEDVAVYRFYHEKTAACPGGRQAMVAGPDLVFWDGPLAYPAISVRRICPAEHAGTAFGYTPMFDLLGIQEVIDALYSIIVTNQTTFGIQTILAPKGHDLSWNQLAEGLALIEYDSRLGKPEALNLTYTPQEIFGFIRQLEDVMETLSGINSTVRGNPEASLKSGSALALVQSQAIQFASGLQQSYAQLVEDVYTDSLNLLKSFAKTKRVITIVGKHKRHLLREFNGEDISAISRVVVDSGSALSKTTSGRVQIAEQMLQNGLVKTPEQYLALINTGTLDPIVESDNNELILIRQENEALAEGRVDVEVLDTDAHRLHLMEHRGGLASLEARENPDVVQAFLAHMLGHVAALRQADPNLLSLIGEQSLAVAPLPPEQAAGGTPPKELPDLAPPPMEPVLPINPSTGRQWDPQTGGGVIEPQPAVGL